MTLTVGSLFSGIGGLDLGLERAGMTVAWQAENDPYCSRVLAKHWPHVPNLGDVTLIDWSEVPRVDLIAGGYPCQPFSVAGRRQGEQDPRHLWPRMLDAVRVLRPRYALLENVAGHLALGFGRILGDLAEIGYDTEWDCIPAAAVGAPHRRDRVFVVAYPQQRRALAHTGSGRRSDNGLRARRDEPRSSSPYVADPGGERRDRRAGVQGDGWQEAVGCEAGGHAGDRGGAPHMADTDHERSQGRGLPEGPERQTVPHLARGRERVAWPSPRSGGEWSVEPDVGRVAHGVPHRVDRLRALGNAVVPQVAEHIGRLIVEAAA